MYKSPIQPKNMLILHTVNQSNKINIKYLLLKRQHIVNITTFIH